MEDTVSIKVKVADKIIPLKISIDEEEQVRKAVKNLDARIKELRRRYDRGDTKDILARIVLEQAFELATIKSKSWIEDEGVSEQLDEIITLLDSYQES